MGLPKPVVHSAAPFYQLLLSALAGCSRLGLLLQRPRGRPSLIAGWLLPWPPKLFLRSSKRLGPKLFFLKPWPSPGPLRRSPKSRRGGRPSPPHSRRGSLFSFFAPQGL